MSGPDPSAEGGRLRYTFSIVGVQKAGTSTMSALLARHPSITAPVKKELHYFDDDDRDWDTPDHSSYFATRSTPDEVAAGDNSPKYIFHPYALGRMRDYNPDMQLIALFRDPIERLFSQWAMLRERARLRQQPKAPADWPRFITELRPARLPHRFPQPPHPRRFMARSGTARGLYGQQLARGFSLFPREQWLLLDFRTMLADHVAALDLATDHLGLDRFTRYPRLVHRMSGPERVHGTAPTPVEIRDLADYYREDLRTFVELSGIDVSAWPTVRLIEGTMEPEELAAKLAEKVVPGSSAAGR